MSKSRIYLELSTSVLKSDNKTMWKDITRYPRGQAERIERLPTSFELSTQKTSITLTNNHRDYKGEWVIICYELGRFPVIKIPKDATLEQAQNFALSYVKSELSAILESLP